MIETFPFNEIEKKTNMTTAPKKERAITAKGFLHKSTQKAANSATAFIAQYREFLLTGELAKACGPIIARMDKNEVLPTPALREIQNAVMIHIIEKDTHEIERAEQVSAPVTTKPYLATVYHADGTIATRINSKGEEVDLVMAFDLPQRANEWADRRLFDGKSDWYADVTHSKSNAIERKERNDSVSRIMKKKKGPVIHVKSKTTQTLSFGVRCKQDRQSFSHG